MAKPLAKNQSRAFPKSLLSASLIDMQIGVNWGSWCVSGLRAEHYQMAAYGDPNDSFPRSGARLIGKNNIVISSVIPIRLSTAVDGLHGTGESAVSLVMIRFFSSCFGSYSSIHPMRGDVRAKCPYHHRNRLPPGRGLFPRPLTTVARKQFKR